MVTQLGREGEVEVGWGGWVTTYTPLTTHHVLHTPCGGPAEGGHHLLAPCYVPLAAHRGELI